MNGKEFEVFTLGKTTNPASMEGQGEFLYGYVNGERFNVTNTPEQISAFIVKHQYESVMLVSFLDIRLIETAMGFIQYCADQEYLRTKLIPVLAPMQMGTVEKVEFVPYQETSEEDYILSDIRLTSGAGHYLGSLIFDEGFPEPYSRETGYYPTEESVKQDHPDSISYSEAIEKARQKGWIN